MKNAKKIEKIPQYLAKTFLLQTLDEGCDVAEGIVGNDQSYSIKKREETPPALVNVSECHHKT